MPASKSREPPAAPARAAARIAAAKNPEREDAEAKVLDEARRLIEKKN